MGATIPFEVGRRACLESVEAFVLAAEAMSEHDLLGASRCHGWSRLDVVAHVVAGWHEMLCGPVSSTQAPPTLDASTFWTGFADGLATDDPVDVLMAQRRRGAAYGRPAAAVQQLGDVGAAVGRGLGGLVDGRHLWLGHVFSAGDFLTVWAVENVVHQLDLLAELAAPAGSLALVRATVESRLPSSWSDEEAALRGTGRLMPEDDDDAWAALLPALG